ncbi:MAG: hypothetical protein KIT33_15365 [Candidatus Kapabacteria bacterium]|nr:hypothetical protein [Ignavibacteriota bacterium]MCW5886348.1 hypothetical protein [Candidatus Kapabacteria bacterium]
MKDLNYKTTLEWTWKNDDDQECYSEVLVEIDYCAETGQNNFYNGDPAFLSIEVLKTTGDEMDEYEEQEVIKHIEKNIDDYL